MVADRGVVEGDSLISSGLGVSVRASGAVLSEEGGRDVLAVAERVDGLVGNGVVVSVDSGSGSKLGSRGDLVLDLGLDIHANSSQGQLGESPVDNPLAAVLLSEESVLDLEESLDPLVDPSSLASEAQDEEQGNHDEEEDELAELALSVVSPPAAEAVSSAAEHLVVSEHSAEHSSSHHLVEHSLHHELVEHSSHHPSFGELLHHVSEESSAVESSHGAVMTSSEELLHEASGKVSSHPLAEVSSHSLALSLRRGLNGSGASDSRVGLGKVHWRRSHERRSLAADDGGLGQNRFRFRRGNRVGLRRRRGLRLRTGSVRSSLVVTMVGATMVSSLPAAVSSSVVRSVTSLSFLNRLSRLVLGLGDVSSGVD